MSSERQPDPNPGADLWAFRAVAQPLLSVEISPARLGGLTGELARTRTAVWTDDDLRALLLPGLPALGLAGDLLPMPDDDAALFRLLTERLRHGVEIPVFAFSDSAEADREMLAKAQNTAALLPAGRDAPPIPPNAERALIGQGVVMSLDDGTWIVWRDENGQRTSAQIGAFRAAFTHILRLRRVPTQGRPHANSRAALLRWLAFAAARPERALIASKTDAPLREQAVVFLREVVGNDRSPVGTRLRRAIATIESADNEDALQNALRHLREAALRDLQLPALVQNALLSAPNLPLSEVERRELIYLARAGVRDLKILAAQRLQAERHHADAQRTLEQIAEDPDPWCRAIALPRP